MNFKFRVLSVTLLVTLWVISVSATGVSYTKAVVRATPGFKEDCQNCSVGEECQWCADFGSLCLERPLSCCGCVKSNCYSCPSSASCALWLPSKPQLCPHPRPYYNNTRWGSCDWHIQTTIEHGDLSVLRCNSIDPEARVNIAYDVASPTGDFGILVLSPGYFAEYINGGRHYSCINPSCKSGGTHAHKYGYEVVSGLPGIYVVVDDYSRRGASQYTIKAAVW